jgi:hypothetical protein
MGKSAHAAAADEVAARWQQTPDGRERLAHADLWRRDRANAGLLAVFGSPYRGWTTGQLAALATLLTLRDQRLIEIAYVPLGHIPRGDAARAENQAALADLPLGFTAEVYDGAACAGDCDGSLTIPDDLVIVDEVDMAAGDRLERPARPWSQIPLEIGSTDASRTFLHLAESGAVARWPYGHDRVHIITTTPPYNIAHPDGGGHRRADDQGGGPALVQPALAGDPRGGQATSAV